MFIIDIEYISLSEIEQIIKKLVFYLILQFNFTFIIVTFQ
jgi:hypothetical protein